MLRTVTIRCGEEYCAFSLCNMIGDCSSYSVGSFAGSAHGGLLAAAYLAQVFANRSLSPDNRACKLVLTNSSSLKGPVEDVTGRVMALLRKCSLHYHENKVRSWVGTPFYVHVFELAKGRDVGPQGVIDLAVLGENAVTVDICWDKNNEVETSGLNFTSKIFVNNSTKTSIIKEDW